MDSEGAAQHAQQSCKAGVCPPEERASWPDSDRLFGAARISPSAPTAGGFSVFAGVGERTREGNDLYREMIESGKQSLQSRSRIMCPPLLELMCPA
jgi:hypothetical protein